MSIFTQTKREKRASVDGMNLFFGALLGANLGTVGELSLLGYVALVLLLSGAVVTLRLVSTSERRRYAYGLLGLYAVTVYWFLFGGFGGLKGFPEADKHRLAATLAIWVVFVLTVELYPVREVSKTSDEPADAAEER